MRNDQQPNGLVILYFGGNGEDVLYTARTASLFNAASVLVANYPGYGGSEGEPSERALFEDGLAIYDFVVLQKAPPENIVLVGRSLGSGVATFIASVRNVKAIVLITPYDSIAAIAKERYPMLPVNLLIRHPFRSDERAKRIEVPVLMLAGEQDFIIPPRHARRLFDLWAGPKEIKVLTGVGHNDIDLHADYYTVVNRFLDRQAR